MTEPASRYHDLAALLGEPAHHLPRGVSREQADRHLEVELAAASSQPSLLQRAEVDAAHRAAAGAEEYRDGYRQARLADVSFVDLRLLVGRARSRLAALDRELAALAEQRAKLARLLRPTPKGQ